MPRVFIAVDLDSAIKEKLIKDIEEIRGMYEDVKCSIPRVEGLHITLRFIGDVDQNMVNLMLEPIQSVVERFKEFKLKIKNRGVFPNHTSPRVIWVGVEENRNIVDIKDRLDKVLERLNLPSEKKLFKPHITIARVKNITDRGKRLLREFVSMEQEYGEFTVREIVLYESILDPSGAIYKQISRFRLKQ